MRILRWNLGTQVRSFLSTLSLAPGAAWTTFNESVYIPAGRRVILDVGNLPQLNSIEVDGMLVFDNIDIQLNVNWIKVNAFASFIMGSTESGCSITNKIVITFHGQRDKRSPIGFDPADGSTSSAKPS